MHRFFVATPEIEGPRLILKGREWHHCRTVLRTREKDRIALFDGMGTEYLTEVAEAGARSAKLKLLRKTTTPRPPYSITLAQALPKNKTMDLIIQKATELGVYEIIPVLSDRSVIKLEPKEVRSRTERWRDISIEAAKQCGLDWLPRICEPKTVKEITVMRSGYHLTLIGSLQPDAKPLWCYLTDSGSVQRNVLLMIGPEGDFTPAEIGMARSSGFQPLSLGPMVLRCDTAAIYAVSTLSYELRRPSR